jgi:hypothetical protein
VTPLSDRAEFWDDLAMRSLARTILAVAVALTPAAARAQQLDLRPATDPSSTESHALSTARDLELSARTLLGSLPSNPESRPHELARARLRLLAASLLRRGESIGADGAELNLAGRIIAGDLSALDAWLTPEHVDDARALLTAQRLDIPAEQLPTSTFDLDRFLRQSLGPLVVVTPNDLETFSPAWWSKRPPSAPGSRQSPLIPLSNVAQRLSLDAAAAEQAATADMWIVDASQRGSETELARRASVLATRAARAWTEPPKWLLPAGAAKLADDARQAIASLSADPTSEDSWASLRRAADLAEIFEIVDAIPPSEPGKLLRASLAKSIASLSPATPADADRWSLVREALTSADLNALPKAESLPPVSRMAMNQLVLALRKSRDQLLAALPKLLQPSPSMTDPSVLNPLSAHRRKRDEADMMAGIGARLKALAPAPGQRLPERSPERLAIAGLERAVLSATQDFGKAPTRDLALERLRDLAADLDACFALPGEEELRAPVPLADGVFAQLAGDRCTTLLTLVNARREEWLDAVRASTPKKPFTARLSDVAPAWDRYFQLSAAYSDRARGRLDQWAGWHLPGESLDALVSRSRQALSKANDAIDAQQWNDFSETLDALQPSDPALVVGRLALDAALTAPELKSPVPVSLLKLARDNPDPDASWMAGARDSLATLCRLADELHAARQGPKSTSKTNQDRMKILSPAVERALIAAQARIDSELNSVNP